MIRRHFTADSLNMVVNDPSVYEFVKGNATGRIDLSSVVKNPDNVLLMDEHGGVLFLKHNPGVYEAHTQVLPAGRGEWALNMANEALDWMFTKTDCMDVMTRIPAGNHAARAMAKNLNGRLEFRLQKGWVQGDEVVHADIYSWQVPGWMANSPSLIAEGMLFHHKLEQEYARLGKEEPQHPLDPVHDRYVGAASLMFRAGQTHKAVVFYNRWAGMAGYAPISVVSEDPIIIDLQESLVQITDDGDFFVLRIK